MNVLNPERHIGTANPYVEREFICGGCNCKVTVFHGGVIPNRWSVFDGVTICGGCTRKSYVPDSVADKAEKAARDAQIESEGIAWDRYAAAALLKLNYPPVTQLSDMSGSAAQVADAMLSERRKRFPT